MLPQVEGELSQSDDHARLTQFLILFEQSWTPGALATAVLHLEELPPSLRSEALLELACSDLTKNWQSGHHTSTADYLQAYPELAANADAVAVLTDMATQLQSEFAPPGNVPAVEAPTVDFPFEASTDNGDEFLAPTVPTLDGNGNRSARIVGGLYQILGPLGNGGMGTLFKAWDRELEREVALKYPLIRDPRQRDEVLQRFRREAKVLANLDRHNNLCPVYATGEDGSLPFMVIPLIAGQTLREFLDQRGGLPLPVGEAVALVRAVALAMEVVHRKGVLHRDLKPGNIMLEKENLKPVVIDFGLARAAGLESSLHTSTGHVLGTLQYMAPEQVRGEIAKQGPPTDIFSLGGILYELLVGQRPFPGNTASELFDQIRFTAPAAPSSIRPEVGPVLDAICQRALAKPIEDRFQSMAEFAAALEQSLYVSIDRRAESSGQTVSRWPRIVVPSLVIVAVCAVIGLSSAFLDHKIPNGGDVAANIHPETHPSTEAVPIKTEPANPDRAVEKQAGDERDDNELKLKLCWCPPGQFMMGSRPGELGNPEMEVQVQVTLTRGFWIGKYEVTQEHFERIMGSNPSGFSRDGQRAADVDGMETSQFPVESVARAQALVFCRNFTSMERRAGRIDDNDEFTLPTDAQWEYACRAGSLGAWVFGQPPTLRQANFGGGIDVTPGALRRTSVVGQYPANAWGIHDMSGNVWEWVLDWHQPKVPGGVDPEVTRDNSDGLEVTRGGSWTDHPGALIAASRSGLKAPFAYQNTGFRVALVSRRSAAHDSTATRPDPPSPPLVIENSIGMKLRKIEPGEFLMGQAADEGSHMPPNEPPPPTAERDVRHRVTLTKGFRIGVTEVTQRQWKAVMPMKPWLNQRMSVDDDDHPATYITSFDAKDFCRELSRREGRRYRLPTEAEWEYCCRAGTQTTFSFGNDSALLGDHAWFRWNSRDLPHPVAKKDPNPWGLYDMHGNVSEVCSDWLGDYSPKSVTDPMGPSSGTMRVVRGGAYWHLFHYGYRSAFRGDALPALANSEHGFRVVLDDDGALAERDQSNSTGNSPARASPVKPQPARAPFEADEARRLQQRWADYLGVPVTFENAIGMTFSLIPPGEFDMGGGAKSEDEIPVNGNLRHRVTLTKPFYLGTYETRQRHFVSVSGTNPSNFSPNNGGSLDHPVETVRLVDIEDFCRRLPSVAGELGTGRFYRLPTEAEWEYACRAGTTTRFSCGETITRAQANLGGTDNEAPAPVGTTTRVGSYTPNAWGLFDMHGNVGEWTGDFKTRFNRDPVVDPRNHINDEFKVFKGGDFGTATPNPHASSGMRYYGGLGSRGSSMGFRVALEIPLQPAGLLKTSVPKKAAAAAPITEAIGSTVKSLCDSGGEWRALVDENTALPDPAIWSFQNGVLQGGNGQKLGHYSSSELSLRTITAKDLIVRSRVTITERVTSDVMFVLRQSDKGKYVAWNNDWFGLAKWTDGRHQQLTEIKDKYFFPREIDWAVAAVGNRLSNFVEGSRLYETTDNGHSAGSVALSVKHNGGAFREPEVMILDGLSDLTPERIHKTVNERMREMRPGVDERAAAWVLQAGGDVTVEVGSERRVVAADSRLPEGEFRLIKVGLAGQKKLKHESLSKLRHLQHLQSLDLYHSSVSDEQLKSAGLPTSLTRLHLGNTVITDAVIPSLAALPNLTEVILSDTLVSEQGVLQLLPLKKLVFVEFNHSPWSAPIMEVFPQWPDLKMLGVSRHWIRPDTVAVWATHPSLTDLFICGDLNHEQLQLLRPMEKLRFLTFIRNHSLDNEMLRGMSRFPKLINVAFVASPLQPATLREIRSLLRLKLLSLQHGPYTDEHLAALQDADHLEHLQLFGTQVTPARVAQFKAAHPRCRVESDISEVSEAEIK